MEMEAAAAAAMVDLNTLSRRELQALCKLNGVRANMTNVAMVEALQSLPSVDGIDQIGTTLCLPTPGKSAMKSVLRTAAASESDQQQLGSPLPRGRRVSVKSPEAIRMDAEGEEDDTKRDLVREIVRTPGVALRSTSRRPRATPAPLPTPAAGTLRRSKRSTVRKATAPVEVDVSTTKRSTRKTTIPKVIDFGQEEEEVQQVDPKGVTSDENPGVASDEKCHDPEEEDATKIPEEGNSKSNEAEQGEEGAAIGEEEKLLNAENSAPLSAMEDSPILGVLSKVAPAPLVEGSPILGVLSKVASAPAMKNVENSSTEDHEVFGNLSPVLEMADEAKNASEDKEVVAVEVPEEAVKEDVFNSTVEGLQAAAAPNKLVPAAMTEKEVAVDESAEEYDLVGDSSVEAGVSKEGSEVDGLDEKEEDMLKADQTVEEESDGAIESAAAPNNMVSVAVTEKEVSADEQEDMLKADQAVDEESDDTIESAAAPNNMVSAAVTEKEVSADDLLQADLTDDESGEDYDLTGESSEEADLSEESREMDDLDEEEDDMLKADQSVDEVSGSIDVNFDSDEEEDQLKMLETGEGTKEFEESDSLTGAEDDFSGDLSSEFDDLGNFSDAETASESSPKALEGINAAAAAASSAAKTVESVITEEIEVSSKGDVISQHAETIVGSLDKVTITKEKKEECAKEKQQLKVGTEMSLRKLKSAYKESLIAAKEGKKLTITSEEGSRMALVELDNNAEC
uniref:Uncharacterized protein n=1 Tax=Avena sativa TaxID=4498 RepID=A0ACD5XU77_AVESA